MTTTYQAMPEDEIRALCEERNCDLIVSDANTLLLDLDTDEAKEQFDTVRPVVEQSHPFAEVEQYISRSGEGCHVIITLKYPVDDIYERLLLQAALGSDGKREVLSKYRVDQGHRLPSVLFRPRATRATAAVADDDYDNIPF